jgi:hypothetical protein
LTVTACPATFNATLRDEAELLALTVSVTDPPPDQLVGHTVTQAALDEADQPHPAVAFTVRVALAAPASTDTVSGDTE